MVTRVWAMLAAVGILDFNLLPAMHGGGGWNHSAPSAPPATGVG